MAYFPDNFLWGGATSAAQYEGAATEGGRGLSHVDYVRFLERKPGEEGRVLKITPELFSEYRLTPKNTIFHSAEVSISITTTKKTSRSSARWASRHSA